jgi:hypothetical protein
MCGASKALAPRSVVWVTATEDADLYVDYNSSGAPTKIPVKRLQSIKLSDPSDKDMSGAIIFATIPNGSVNSKPVNSTSFSTDDLQLPLL